MITSKNTSINKNKLPAISKLMDWDFHKGKTVLDYGGGKYDNLQEHLKQYSIDLKIYDKYNRSTQENEETLSSKFDFIICSNVLNVLENDILEEVIKHLSSFARPVYITIYEGDGSGVGKVTKKDCYQRNEKLNNYVDHLKKHFKCVSINRGKIICI